MADCITIHLVFAEIEQCIIGEISKYWVITGRHQSLEELSKWAKEAGGKDPDIFLINCSEYFIPCKGQGKARKKAFQQILAGIKKSRPQSRLVLLLPELLAKDFEIIGILLRLELYDFWFLGNYDENDIINSICIKRTIYDLEEYLQEREKESYRSWSGPREINSLSGSLKKIYQPYYIKSNVVTFWSKDDSLINHGLAVLTAIYLAKRGFKTALVETITDTPYLASTLSVPHPYFNTRHALKMYNQPHNCFYKDCFFNIEKYLKDKNSPRRHTWYEDYPKDLFFLPDGIWTDDLNRAEMEFLWKQFVTELARVIIFEKGFHFLIFTSYGKNTYSDVVLDELSYLNFITVNMLPCSIVYAINERRKGQEKVHIIGTKKAGYIVNQLADLAEAPFLYLPDQFAHDFLEYVYLKKINRISLETNSFINEILALIGIKMEREKDTNNKSRLISFNKILRR